MLGSNFLKKNFTFSFTLILILKIGLKNFLTKYKRAINCKKPANETAYDNNKTSGMFISCEIINDPIHIINYTNDLDEPLMNHPLFLIKLGNGSEASTVEHYYGSTNIEYWQNSVTKIELSKNSSMKHFRLQEESTSSFHIADTKYILEKDARLNAFHLATGASKYR